ncbi:hypothetical protein PDJAM_G00146030 [Pangasius djambal]|uniref:Uncharacterized protein n=1 Tax=Pangasius djambal TaxID=1691987 RepID=A0ACC5ZFL2_9TELE|nr:hypothetical protein [Pangasius djambal]
MPLTGKRARERRERGRGAANGNARRRQGNSERGEEKRRGRSGHRCKETPLHTLQRSSVSWNSSPITQVWLTAKLEQLQLYQI